MCLVIEDDADIRHLIELILSGAGYEVRAVATAADGLLAASSLDLVLITLDIGLPDADGRDTARQLRSLSDAPVLMITAYAATDDELAGIAAGATAYLSKPFRPAQLRTLVQKLREQTTPDDGATFIRGLRTANQPATPHNPPFRA